MGWNYLSIPKLHPLHHFIPYFIMDIRCPRRKTKNNQTVCTYTIYTYIYMVTIPLSSCGQLYDGWNQLYHCVVERLLSCLSKCVADRISLFISLMHPFLKKNRAVMMPTMSSLAALEVVSNTTYGTASDHKIGIIFLLNGMKFHINIISLVLEQVSLKCN